MQVQTIFRAGNSSVVAIPKDLAEEVGIKPGQKVIVEKEAGGEGVLIKKVKKLSNPKKSAVSSEFRKWLKEALEEDAQILDELANR